MRGLASRIAQLLLLVAQLLQPCLCCAARCLRLLRALLRVPQSVLGIVLLRGQPVGLGLRIAGGALRSGALCVKLCVVLEQAVQVRAGLGRAPRELVQLRAARGQAGLQNSERVGQQTLGDSSTIHMPAPRQLGQ